MAAFQDTREHTEQKVMVHLLTEIGRNPAFTQRSLANELGIAVGLMNQYLKNCLIKGWVRASQISPRRIRYFLTPQGFSEKSIMVKEYLARSMTFFRDAKTQCEKLFIYAKEQQWCKIALLGPGDLADIAKLVALGTGLELELVDLSANLKKYDAVLITDLIDPQATYDALKNKIACHRILVLTLLHISREAPSSLA